MGRLASRRHPVVLVTRLGSGGDSRRRPVVPVTRLGSGGDSRGLEVDEVVIVISMVVVVVSMFALFFRPASPTALCALSLANMAQWDTCRSNDRK